MFPLNIYWNEYEAGNLSVPCIPPVYQAATENIILALLFHSSDLKQFDSAAVFSKLLKELRLLKVAGIEISVGIKSYNLYFKLCLIIGDNLGVHTMLGLAESFSSNFPCRFGKLNKPDIGYLYKQNDDVLRNKENCEQDLLVGNCSLTGIKKSVYRMSCYLFM